MEPDPDTSDKGAAGTTPPPLGPSPEVRQVLYRAFAVGAIMVAVIILVLAVAAMVLSGLMTAASQDGVPPVTTVPVTSVVTTATTAVPTTRAAPTLPAGMRLVISVDKNSAGHVVVSFNGGEGRSLVKTIEARLIRSDGNVVTGTMDPLAESPQVTLAGTKAADHIEVYALMYSGKRYLILEQEVIPPIRIGSL